MLNNITWQVTDLTSNYRAFASCISIKFVRNHTTCNKTFGPVQLARAQIGTEKKYDR